MATSIQTPSSGPLEAPVLEGLHRFTLLARLGEGSYGEVYEALDALTRKHVAVKVVAVESDSMDLEREIAILRLCARCGDSELSVDSTCALSLRELDVTSCALDT